MAEPAALCGVQRMATSVRGVTVGSTAQAFPRAGGTSKVRRSACPSLRSLFFGSGRFQVFSGATMATVAKRSSKAQTVVDVRSASLFDKLGKLFFSNAADEEQVFGVYEINENDRHSPALLRLTPWKDPPASSDPTLPSPLPTPFLGDLVPYSNKVYGPSGKDLLGVSAGICITIENPPGNPSGVFYNAIYTHYIGKFGQLSATGQYYTSADSEMAVTGGTGVFKGARGIVKVHNIKGPLKILYTYYIAGVQKLPSELTVAVVPLAEETSAATTTARAPVAASTK